MKKVILRFSLITLLLIISFLLKPSIVLAATRTWDGGGGVDTNWSTCSNWDLDTCPTSADAVVFDNTSDNNSTVDAAFGGLVTSIAINSGYDGTITLERTLETSSFFTQASGTFNAGSYEITIGKTSAHDFTLSGGNFTAPSSTFHLGHTLTISGGTFDPNNGTLSMESSSQGLTCNQATTFYLVTSTTTGSKSFGANCTVPLGNNPIFLVTALTINGTVTGTGTFYSRGNVTFGSTGAISGFTGFSTTTVSCRTLTVAGATLDFSNYNLVDICSSFTVSSGSFTAPSAVEMQVGGHFFGSGGTFNANGGTVNLDGAAVTDQIITGANTFHNLKRNATTGSITFPASTTTTVTGNLNLQGTGGTKLSLRSSTTGTQWNIDAQGTRSLAYLDVKDSNNINSTVMQCGLGCLDSGNNTAWSFTTNPVDLTLVSPSDNEYVNVERPTFKWQQATLNNGSTLSKYKLEISNGGTGDIVVDNIPAFHNDPIETDKYKIVYENFEDSVTNNNYISFYTKSSSSWNSNENNGIMREGKRNFKVTVYDQAGTSQSFSRDFFVDYTKPSLSDLLNLSQNSISGKITDFLSGDPKASSGPYSLTFLSQQIFFLNSTYFANTKNLITNNASNFSDKYSSFIVSIPSNYISSTITATVSDLAHNETSFILYSPAKYQSTYFTAVSSPLNVVTQEIPKTEKEISFPEEPSVEPTTVQKEIFPEENLYMRFFISILIIIFLLLILLLILFKRRKRKKEGES